MKSSNQKEQQVVASIPRLIHQENSKQLVHAMVPGEVLCVAVTSENFKPLGLDLNDFLVALHQRDQEKICFVVEQVVLDLSCILQRYCATHPDCIRMVPIADPWDFYELSRKAGTISAGKKSGYEQLSHLAGGQGTYQAFYNQMRCESGWITLDLDRIKAAHQQIPPQETNYDCGVNTGARALILAGSFPTSYQTFYDNCYRYRGSTIALNRSATIFTAGWLGGLIGAALMLTPLAPVAPSIVKGSVASGVVGGAIPGIIAQSNPTSPSPNNLATYLNQYLSGSAYDRTRLCSYDYFDECAKAIAQDIQLKDPVVIFLLYGPMTWHWANIVATKDPIDPGVGKFMKLEVGGAFEWLTYQDLAYLMRNNYKTLTFFGCKGHVGNYNIIRFYKKDYAA